MWKLNNLPLNKQKVKEEIQIKNFKKISKLMKMETQHIKIHGTLTAKVVLRRTFITTNVYIYKKKYLK